MVVQKMLHEAIVTSYITFQTLSLNLRITLPLCWFIQLKCQRAELLWLSKMICSI